MINYKDDAIHSLIINEAKITKDLNMANKRILKLEEELKTLKEEVYPAIRDLNKKVFPIDQGEW